MRNGGTFFDVGLRGLPDAYLAFAIPHIILSAMAAIWSNEAYHKFFRYLYRVFPTTLPELRQPDSVHDRSILI